MSLRTAFCSYLRGIGIFVPNGPFPHKDARDDLKTNAEHRIIQLSAFAVGSILLNMCIIFFCYIG